MDVEWPLRCISKSPQESVVERLSSSFQEFFSTPFREPIIWRRLGLQPVSKSGPRHRSIRCRRKERWIRQRVQRAMSRAT